MSVLKFGSLYLGKAQQLQEPVPISVCSIFVCSDDGMAASVLYF